MSFENQNIICLLQRWSAIRVKLKRHIYFYTIFKKIKMTLKFWDEESISLGLKSGFLTFLPKKI